MNISDIVNKVDTSKYLFKVVNSQGKNIYYHYRPDYLLNFWNTLTEKDCKLYAYTKNLKPTSILLAWN